MSLKNKLLVLASNNAGKLRELQAMLAPLHYELKLQREFTPDEAPEPHCTFVENALAKARFASRVSGLAALADDSGICAPALSNAPGVLSARYAGEPKDDQANNRLLVQNLRGQSDRRAFYVCVLVMVQHAEDPTPLIAEGRWHGKIIDTPRGSNGFGYDPYFELPELGQTAAELPSDLKNRISHRAIALRALLNQLEPA